jgi:DNA sulfur modification protein DndB
MATKTLIPALKAHVGDWPYYICTMKYGAVAREVNFAYELNNGNKELADLIQRGISDRTNEIVKYLLTNESRFLGSMIVAAWGGKPLYHPVTMNDPDGLLQNLDSDFGVLEFNGSQQYFAIDGQHRLRAIKDSIKQNPDLGNEDICVLIVSHFDNEEGRRRTRRLFTNINKHAKKTTKAEDIALDEDDPIAITTRRLLMEHWFLKQNGRVRVVSKSNDDGGLKLATGNVSKTDSTALFTMGGLYEIVKSLVSGFGLAAAGKDQSMRPTDEILESTYDGVSVNIDKLLAACGNIAELLEKSSSARELRAPKHDEGQGHPFMRAMIQRVIANVVAHCIQGKLMEWDELQTALSQMDWTLAAAPWNVVARQDGSKVKMLTNRDYPNLLQKLLLVHLCPTSKAQVQQVRSEYKKLCGQSYQISEAILLQNLRQPPSVIKEIDEISGDFDDAHGD